MGGFSFQGDGDAALLHAAAHRPDLIILDLSLPKRDGMEVLAELRELRNDASVLVLTGRNELDARVVAIAERIAGVPAELLQINKRSVHRAMEIMGIRTGIRAGSELQAIASNLPSVRALLAGDALASVKQAAGQ